MTALQLMGIETPADFGGAESSFTAAIIAIEELAKVDPSVSVLCDVHNTLVNTVVRKYGTKEQQEKWLPKLAESSVRRPLSRPSQSVPKHLPLTARQFLSLRTGFRLRRIRPSNTCQERRFGLGDQRVQDVDHQLLRSRLFLDLCQCRPKQGVQGHNMLHRHKRHGCPNR